MTWIQTEGPPPGSPRKKWLLLKEDAYYTSADGTRTLIARAGERISRAQAIRLGIVKSELYIGPPEHK